MLNKFYTCVEQIQRFTLHGNIFHRRGAENAEARKFIFFLNIKTHCLSGLRDPCASSEASGEVILSFFFWHLFPALARLLLYTLSVKRNLMKSKVLVCDDDPAVCEIISAMLRDGGYEVQEEYDGIQALENLREGRYEVMILDYMLGKTNGLDILQEACQVDHEVRIIMISGYQSDDLPKRAKELGASGFLSKPFLMHELLNVVGKSKQR